MSAIFKVECVAPDVLDTILKFTAKEDLDTVANAITSWREAVLREKARRFDTLQLYVPLFSNMAKSLPTNLHTSLLFYDEELESSLSSPFNGLDKIEDEVLDDFKGLPGKRIALKVKKCLGAEIEYREPKMMRCAFNQINNYISILGYFFPNIEGQNGVRVACVRSNVCEPLSSSSDDKIDGVVNYFAEELGMNDHRYPRSTLLVFTNKGRDQSGVALLRTLRKRAAENGQELTCNIVCGTGLAVGNHNSNSYKGTEIGLVALRIFGPSVESWSTQIHYFSTGFEIERKLQELEARVRFKRYATGLISSPVCQQEGCSKCMQRPCGNCYELMSYVKRTFPGVSFVGLFNREHSLTASRKFSDVVDDSPDFYGGDKSDFQILHLYTKVIIISFD